MGGCNRVRRRLQPRAAEAATLGVLDAGSHRAHGTGLVRDEHGEGGGLAAHGVQHLQQVQG